MKSTAHAATASSSPVPSVGSWASTATRLALRATDFVSLTKPRLNVLVLMTTLAGLYLASPEGVELATLVHTLIGTALVAGGAAAFNQVWERDTDALMGRTRGRPVANGRLGSAEAAWFAALLATAGVVELASFVNVLSAGIATLTLGTYVLAYTPLKRRTSLSTLVGAIPGALPPVIGWAAAEGTLTLPAVVLFGIVFLWQMPISWQSRGFIVMSMQRQAFHCCQCSNPTAVARDARHFSMPRRSGPSASCRRLWVCRWFLHRRRRPARLCVHRPERAVRQRAVPCSRSMAVLFSITYLPLLWAALVADRLWI